MRTRAKSGESSLPQSKPNRIDAIVIVIILLDKSNFTGWLNHSVKSRSFVQSSRTSSGYPEPVSQ